MIDFFEVIRNRRSVRRYTADPVTDEELQTILEAGLWAPSGLNLQPWYLVAVRSDEKKRDLLDIMEHVSHEIRGELEDRYPDRPKLVSETAGFIGTLGNAPVILLAFLARPDYQDKRTGLLSVAAAVENMLLQARSMEIGSCWLTAANQTGRDAEIRDKFAPGKGDLVAIVTLGHTDSFPRPIPRKADRFVIL